MPRRFAMSLDVTPTQSEWRQKPSGLRALKAPLSTSLSMTAVERARFFTVLTPSMMMARARLVTWVPRP